MEEINNLPRSDRDLLIAVSTKQDTMASDIKEIRTDLLGRIVKTETRLDSIDIYHASIPLKEYEALAIWVRNFKSNIKFMMVAAGLLFGLIGGIVSQFISRWFHIK